MQTTICSGIALALALAPPALGQAIQPIMAQPLQAASAVLPRNTQVVLRLNETLNTKSKSTRKGETFTLSVVRNVLLDGYVVIPRGAKAVGSIPWRTGKGAFGKSGKMELSLDYIEIGDQRIPLEGRHREEGEGNSGATIATAVLLSVIGAGLITGHSAEVPQGREFLAYTKEDVPVNFAGLRQVQPALQAVRASPPQQGLVRAVARPNPEFGNGRVRCVTCR